MKTDEIVKLSREGIVGLLRARRFGTDKFNGKERRGLARWPFPGTAELRTLDGAEQWFGTIVNLSEGGLGLTTEEHFQPGTPVDIAFHLPEASFYGKATIRHCLDTPCGFRIGVEFDYAN